MKVYHYVSKPNNASNEGILSLFKNPHADLRYYYKRSGKTSHKEIVRWFEDSFAGRSRGIRVFSEPIRWTAKSLSLKEFVENADMFSIDVDALAQDGFLEAVYVSPPVPDVPTLKGQWNCDELLIKLPDYHLISPYPVDWSMCDDELGRRFAFVPYYLLVIKDGVILPRYFIKERITF
jgi:hypothetical protein